ncbi:MAG: hypothetical protein PHI98_03485 [Eubacteriales bacterium]|nr:hypothetical protein [Eubacteriales bacterium]
MTLDMLQGRPLRLLLQFALPLRLSSLLQQLYRLCGSRSVSRLLGVNAHCRHRFLFLYQLVSAEHDLLMSCYNFIRLLRADGLFSSNR